MEQDRSKLVLGFLLGLAAGAVAGFLLAGGKKEDLEKNLGDAAGNLKEEINDYIQKGETLMSEMAKKADEFFGEKQTG